MQSALVRLNEIKDDMSSTQNEILNFIVTNPHEVTQMTIRELAEKTYSSPSTIVRLCRDVGFKGFTDFKQAIMLDLVTLENSNDNQEINENDTISEIIEKVTYLNVKSLDDTMRLLDENTIAKCIELLIKSKTIMLFGLGSSNAVAKDMYLKFLRLNHPCIVNEDWHAQLVTARNSTKNDVAIIFSYSGETKEMLTCLQTCKANGTPTIAITRYAKTPISKEADYNLYVSSVESLFRKGAMSSRLAQLNIVDILFTGFVNYEYDFAMKQLVATHIDKEKMDI